MQRTGSSDFLNYIEEVLKDDSKQLEEAVTRAMTIRQCKKYVDDDLKADLSHIKMLLSDVQRMKSEVLQYFSHRKGWDNTIFAESVALLEQTSQVEHKAKRLIANMEADLYRLKGQSLKLMLDDMQRKLEIQLNAMLNDYKYRI